MGATEQQGAIREGERGGGRDALARLLDVAIAAGPLLASAERLDTALAEVFRRLCAAASWDSARYLLVEEPGGRLRQAAASGASHSGVLLGGGEALPEWLAGDPVWITDVESDARARGASSRGTALLVPVVSERRTVGVTELHSSRVATPDAVLVRLVEGLARQLASIAARSAAFERLRDSEGALPPLCGSPQSALRTSTTAAVSCT